MPMDLLSFAMGRSPCSTWISTLVWNAAAVLLAMGAAFFALSWLLLRRAMIRPAK